MNIGELIGAGRTAEVYAVGEERVVKLLRPGFPASSLEAEAAKTQAAHDAGVPAPATWGPATVDGRPGHMFDRIDGTLMLDDVRRRPWRLVRHGGLLGRLQADMHTRSAPGLPPLRERLGAAIESAPDLEHELRTAALERLRQLPEGDRILHGDFHPGNVLLSPSGPVVIDWLDAARGDPAADVARTTWLLSSAVIGPETPLGPLVGGLVGSLRRRYLASYARVSAVGVGRVGAWRLPVLVGRLSEEIDHEREPLLAAIRRLVTT